MKSKKNFLLSITGVGIIWVLWFILLILTLMNDYRMIDRIALILLFLIVLAPLFFAILLNPRMGIIIGFFGTLIPSIIFLNSHYGSISFFLVVMVLSMLSGLLKLIKNNTRQEELIILHLELKNIRSFYISAVDWTRNHPLLTTFMLSLVASIVGGLIIWFFAL